VSVSLKKKRFLFGKDVIGDKKKFKLTDLAKKCDMQKDIKIQNLDFSLSFHIITPIKEKEM
jgi:hypothetical protein